MECFHPLNGSHSEQRQVQEHADKYSAVDGGALAFPIRFTGEVVALLMATIFLLISLTCHFSSFL